VSAGPFALPAEVRARLDLWRAAGDTVVFTNGVYELLHRGHVE
jgi:bifunctional ADP-heptose synthase (sugar kinase/adenylyltransferase)